MKKLKKPAPTTKSNSILDRITKVSEMSLVVTAVFYGRSGTGKTTAAATFPKPLLVLDIGEKGTDSVYNVEGVDVLRINKWSEIEEIYWELKNGSTKYKSIVLDALHSMQDLAIEEAKSINSKDESDQTSKRDFGTAAGLMKTWIYNYRDLEELNLNVVFIVHDRVTKEEGNEDDGALAPEVGPRLMPSVASPLTGAVKVVGHTFIREQVIKSKKLGEKPQRNIQYCMRVGPHSYYTTKVRTPKNLKVPDFIIDPDYQKIVRVMRGLEGTPESSAVPTKKIRRKL